MKTGRFLFWLSLLLTISGCNPVSPVPELTPTAHTRGEVISLMTEDNVRLSATYYPAGGDLAVVYAHMGIADQSTWQAFAAETADQGITALTFDFRCFGSSGCSGGVAEIVRLTDVLTAIQYLRDQGYQRIVCMGASMGANACMHASLQEELAGLVFIAGAYKSSPYHYNYPDDLPNPDMPKLFIVTDQDPYPVVIGATKRYYEDSQEPKQLFIYPETVHGTDIFTTASGSQFHQVLMDFLLAIK
jgi:pimeloyl-ACP methyl ester carboxylesterase